MKYLSLRQLKVFEASARHGSFTRAAEELYLTQPTVSMQVKKLTEAVGLPLFEQLGKRIYLTDAGRELLELCHQVFQKLHEFDMTIADMKGLKEGQLRLTVVTTAEYFAPRLLGPFCQHYPGIDVSLKVTNRERALERLQGNVDDLYILGQPPEGLDVQCFPFVENPLVVLAPRDHPLVGANSIPLKRLAEEPFLMREPGSGTRNAVQRLFRQHGLTPNVRMELGSNEAIKQAIIGGLGVSVLSRHAMALEGVTGQIATLDVEGFPIQRYWYVVYPEGKQLSVVARTFLAYLETEGRQTAESALDDPWTAGVSPAQRVTHTAGSPAPDDKGEPPSEAVLCQVPLPPRR